MAQKILTLDIREEYVCGIMVSVSGTSSSVVDCAVSVVSEGNIAASIDEVVNHLEYKDEACRVAFGAENFFFRNLTFPFSDKKKIEKILEVELEESVPGDIEELVVDSLITGRKGEESTVVAALASRQFIEEQLDLLSTIGLDPEVVAISGVQTVLQAARLQGLTDCVLVDGNCGRVTLFVMQQGRMRLIRPIAYDDLSSTNFALDQNSQMISAKRPEKIDETLRMICRDIKRTLYSIETLVTGTPFMITGSLSGLPEIADRLNPILGCKVTVCELVSSSTKVGLGCGLWRTDIMTSALALAIRSGKKQAGFNFRKGEYVRKVSYTRYKKLVPKLGVPAALCLLVVFGYFWNDYSLRQKELDGLQKQSADIFSDTLPDIKRIVDPVQQLKVEVRGLKRGTVGEATSQPDVNLLDLLAEISVRIPPSINVHIVRMVADKKSILLRGLTDNFNSVDSIKKVLEKSAYFNTVTINSANLATRSSGIRFELRLELNKG